MHDSARVLTYGYDTHIRHKLGRSGPKDATIYDFAWDFLVALEAGRRDEPFRPILFIAHSLGGIIVKELLRRSSDDLLRQSHLRSVSSSTIGVMFFGTPHGGADPRGILRSIAERVFKATGLSVNEQIVNSLLPSGMYIQREVSFVFAAVSASRDPTSLLSRGTGTEKLNIADVGSRLPEPG